MSRRLALTAMAFGAVLVAVLGLVPLALMIVSLPLIVGWIGIPMFLAAVTVMRLFARPWRYWAGRLADEPIIVPYRSFPGGGWFARLRWMITDKATWRELAWSFLNATVGFALALVPPALLAGAVFYLIYPLLLAATPPGVFDNPFGLFTLPWWPMGVVVWPVAVILLAGWWRFTPTIMLGWTALQRRYLGPSQTDVLEGRVAALAASRADTVDSAAREVRRIERDLHDGVQVRLVSLGMSLGLAAELVDTDPERAKALIDEATSATSGTLQDLRTLVRGIHPPVLADRGLVGAVRSLALDAPIDTTVEIRGFGADEEVRLDAPVEACAYFAVAEALANIAKHAGADRTVITVDLGTDGLRLDVLDNGGGAAQVVPGGGLAGIERRLAAFDGRLTLASPPGGPTQLTMEIPCVPLSPKTTPSSAKA